MPNLWLSLCSAPPISWANAVRGFWTAELRRQQTAMANEMVRQTMTFWARAWMMPYGAQKPKRRR